MVNQLKIIALCAFPLVLHGCGGSAEAAEQRSLSNTIVIHQGISPYSGGYTSKGHRVFVTQTDYQNELPNYSGDAPQNIDFEDNRVVLLDLGQRDTGGYGIAVESVADNNDHVLITVVSTVSGQSCMVTPALTNPYQFVKIATDKEILILEKLQGYDCG